MPYAQPLQACYHVYLLVCPAVQYCCGVHPTHMTLVHDNGSWWPRHGVQSPVQSLSQRFKSYALPYSRLEGQCFFSPDCLKRHL